MAVAVAFCLPNAGPVGRGLTGAKSEEEDYNVVVCITRFWNTNTDERIKVGD